MLGKLNDFQSRNVLVSQVIGRLACSDGTKPYIIPITYTFDGTYIYGQTNEGKKLEILRNNPNICFEVDMMTDMRNWKSVIVYGQFEELTGIEAKKARDVLFGSIFQLMTSSTVHPHEHETGEAIDDSARIKFVMYRIKVDEITGRFESQSISQDHINALTDVQ